MKINFQNLEIDYEPYPIGIAPNIFDETTYNELLDNFPDIKNFKVMRNTKFSFNERTNGFKEFVAEHKVWREFEKYITSHEFVASVFNILRERNIDLGYKDYAVYKRGESGSKLKKLYRVLRGYTQPVELETKFEFSALHPDGGAIWPHTDSKSKVVTLVFSMIGKEGWQTKWGGGTSALQLKDNSKIFDRTNKYKPEFDEVDVIKTYEFLPNQCLLFVKTFNSWHSVMPMKNPELDVLRKSLTINIIQR